MYGEKEEGRLRMLKTKAQTLERGRPVGIKTKWGVVHVVVACPTVIPSSWLEESSFFYPPVYVVVPLLLPSLGMHT